MQNITEYWYLWIVVFALIPILVFAVIKASKAAKKRNELIEKQQQELQKLKRLAKQFSLLDKETAEKTEPKKLAEGVTAALQYELEKSQTPDELFENTVQWKKTAYSLFYFDEDVATSLSFFFKHNGGPVPKIAVDGLSVIGYSKITACVREMFGMYDENNESVSLDKNRTEILDEKFVALYSSDELFEKLKIYITANL